MVNARQCLKGKRDPAEVDKAQQDWPQGETELDRVAPHPSKQNQYNTMLGSTQESLKIDWKTT